MTMITENKGNEKFFKFTPQHLDVARNLKVNELKLWLYLSLLDPFGDRSIDLPPLEEIEEKTGLKKSAYYKAIASLRDKELLPEWVKVKEARNLEKEITDRLQKELGGLREVITAVGRIDLLTETELIEVKNVKSWKQALGQILAYSAFYPEHNKRIHLFGENLANLKDIELSCLSFGISVTGEILVNEEVK